jgi:hypothetical protein
MVPTTQCARLLQDNMTLVHWFSFSIFSPSFFIFYLQDNMTLVHWWYYPDSYREWKPQSKIFQPPEPPMPTPQLWKVQVLICWCWRGFLAFPPPKPKTPNPRVGLACLGFSRGCGLGF